MYLRRGLYLSLIFVTSLYSQIAPPSSAPAPTFKANVRVVLVDVVVTAGKNEPVPGLDKKDFEVFEDGRPQTIATFEEHKGAPLTQVKLPPMPSGVYTNYPAVQTSDAVNVLLLDALNTTTRDQTYVHTEMIKYLKSIPPGTRVAIFTLASRLRMVQPVTSNSDELLAVLKSKESGAAGPHPSPLLPSEVEKDTDQHVIDFMIENQPSQASHSDSLNSSQDAVDPISSMKQFLSDSANFQQDLRIRITLLAMQQLGRYLSDIPGRKNVIWFSGSFPIAIFPDRDLPDPAIDAEEFAKQIRETGDMLTADHMAIYPIAAAGLATEAVYEADGSEIQQKRPMVMALQQRNELRTENMHRGANYATMEELAKTTGGEAFYDANGLGDALLRVIHNGTRYYTITYAPTNESMDGKYRHIEIKLAGGKYKLAYRRGYYADDLRAKVTQDSGADPLLPLMGVNLPNISQILYKVRVLPSNPQPQPDAPLIGSNKDLKGRRTRYVAEFAISVQDLKLNLTPDGVRHGDIEVALIAYDHEGKPLNMVIKQAGLLLKPDVYKSMEKVGLQFKSEIDVPDGNVLLRTGVFDVNANQAGTLLVPLSNPIMQAQSKP
jgi:VWFA-related protein